jgi:amidase
MTHASTDLLCYISATEAVARFRTGDLSPVDVIRALKERAEQVDPIVNAFTITYYDEALGLAEQAAERYRDGTARALEGVAVAIKDGTAIAGQPQTYGSKVYADHVADSTHPGAQRLLDAGAIIVGRTTMPEFGEAGNCYTPLWGVTRNPWNPEYGPGGSSSGAGVALAAGMTTLADGSDIGGSSRIPASCNGVLGYKPPFGRNPLPYEATFDPYMHYGPLTRTVDDMVLIQNVISGVSVEDIFSLRDDYRLPAEPEDIAGWKIAYSVDLGYFQVDDEVRQALLDTVEVLRTLGCEVEEVDLGWTEEAFDAWATVNASRGSAARKVGDVEKWRDDLSDYVLDWLDKGSNISGSDLADALEYHVEMYRSIGPVLERNRVLLCPTNAIPSVPAERSPLDLDWTINGEPVRPKIGEAWFMTYPFNVLSQLPALSAPIGRASTGVPIGAQIVGPSFDDAAVMALAAALEKALPRPEWPAVV